MINKIVYPDWVQVYRTKGKTVKKMALSSRIYDHDNGKNKFKTGFRMLNSFISETKV